MLSTTALACEVILGIQDDHFRVADAATIPDPCIHAEPPPPPDASDEGLSLPNLVFAIEHARVDGIDEAGTPVGFDVDGVCTCDTRPGSAHGGAPSCAPRDPDASACDREGGIDNSASSILPPEYAAVIDSQFDTQVACGRQAMLIQLSGYNGLADDPVVQVALTPSYGIFDPHDGGEDFDAAATCGDVGDAAPGPTNGYPAKLDGTDLWSVPAAAVDQGVLVERYAGYVTKARLVVKLDASPEGTGGWSLIVGGRVLPFQTMIFVANLNRQPDGHFRLDEGIISARIAADDMLSTIGSTRIYTNESACADQLYPALKSVVCRSADLAQVARADFTGARCDALSLVLQFSAGPAAIGGTMAPQTEPAPGCGVGFVDTCANAP
jgi:hypothetical protein